MKILEMFDVWVGHECTLPLINLSTCITFLIPVPRENKTSQPLLHSPHQLGLATPYMQQYKPSVESLYKVKYVYVILLLLTAVTLLGFSSGGTSIASMLFALQKP